MKVKDEELKRELQTAISGNDTQANCASRLGIHTNRFKIYLCRARGHGIEAVLHRNQPKVYGDGFKFDVVHCMMQEGLPWRTAETRFNVKADVIQLWVGKFIAVGVETLLADNRGRAGEMGRKPKPRLDDFEPGSVEYLKLENEKLKRELSLLKKHCPWFGKR